MTFLQRESLISGFFRSLRRGPDRPALELGEQQWSYAQLWSHAGRVAQTLSERIEPSERVVALLAHRSLTAYAGVLGILASGRGYVPLNPKFPLERNLTMLLASGCKSVVAGSECTDTASALLSRLDEGLTWLFPDRDCRVTTSECVGRHHSIASCDMKTVADPQEPNIEDNATAYLLFTSGSTGVPKGVAVSQENVTAYMQYVGERYGINEEDRCSQNFDLTFDLSVHDLFACWGGGATLCPLSGETLVPATLINEKNLTVWFSVPSVAMFSSKVGLLDEGSFPTLRLSLFCGEALSASLAAAWQRAANRSILENLYGPTEATIAITHYRWDPERSPAECVNGIVPIGSMFQAQECSVVDDNLLPVANEKAGELCLAGSQVTCGYLNDPVKTALQFVRLPQAGEKLWYRTGDLVRQDHRGCLYYLGRKDHQVKISGYRVELQEIDLVLRDVAGTELAIAVPWPIVEGTAAGIVAVICGVDAVHDNRIIEMCEKRLPRYMIPSRIYHCDELPLNVNGKVDRRKLSSLLKDL